MAVGLNCDSVADRHARSGDDRQSNCRHAQQMTLTAAAASDKDIAGPIVIIVVLCFAVIYGFGYLRAVMHRANRDYKTTKAAVPTLRKAFWLAWWNALKVGFWVFVVLGILVVWMVRGTSHDADAVPTPSSRVSPSRHR